MIHKRLVLVLLCFSLIFIGCSQWQIRPVRSMDIRKTPEDLFIKQDIKSQMIVIYSSEERNFFHTLVGTRNLNLKDVLWVEFEYDRRPGSLTPRSGSVELNYDLRNLPRNIKVQQAKLYYYLAAYESEGRVVSYDKDLKDVTYKIEDKYIVNPESYLKDGWVEVDLTAEVKEECSKIHPSDIDIRIAYPIEIHSDTYKKITIFKKQAGRHVASRLIVEYH